MRFVIIYFISLLTGGLLMSCGSKEQELIDEFPITLKGVKVNSSKPLETRTPANLINLQNRFLYVNPFSNNGVIKIIDIDSTEDIFCFGNLGHGPGEFITPFPQQYSKRRNVITLLDSGKGDLREFRIQDNSILESYRRNLDAFGGSDCLNAFRISDDRFLIRPYRREEGHIEIRDTLGNMICQTQLCPIEGKCQYSHATYILHYNENKEILIIGMAEYGYLAAYSLKNDSIKLIWEKHMTIPSYFMEGEVLKWRKESNRQGFWAIKSTEDFIYTLYAGFQQPERELELQTAPNIILKFDFEGTPIEKILLNEPIMKFSISRDDKELWGIAISPDFHLVKFKTVEHDCK